MASTFAEKTVLVTGASRGIGLEVARRFAAQGARVGLVASNAERLESAAAGITGPHHVVAADLTVPEECAKAVREVSEALGAVEILISCAGLLRRDFIEDVTTADFEQTFRLHVGAAIWLTQAVLPVMRVRGFWADRSGVLGAGPDRWALVRVLLHEQVGAGRPWGGALP